MLSTTTYEALPPAAALQRLCQALAVLDAINSPEEEYRYHTYSPDWGENEAVFELNDGEGDQLLALFRPEGCVINGYLPDYDQPAKDQATRGLPAAFEEFMFGEPVKSIGTTFCLWYTPAAGWQANAPASPDDGSEELLYIFDNQPTTYAEWATEYFTDETDKKPVTAPAVAPLYHHEALTQALVLGLVDEVADWPQLAAEAREIGYPVAFS